MDFLIRNMDFSDIDFALNCTTIEGWVSETREDFENFLAYDPGGCFIAERNGKPVGLCVATNYFGTGFIGELIVIRDARGNGIGKTLLENSIEYLEKQGVLSIYLDGDFSAVSMYENRGFQKLCKSLRFTGRIEGRPHLNVHQITENDLKDIFKIDIALFGADRTFFLERKMKKNPELCKVVKSNGNILGYVFGKRSNGLVSIGPWAQIDPSIRPESLLEVIAYELNNINFRIGVLDSNQNAVKVLRKLTKLSEGEFSWRMVLGTDDNLGISDNLLAIGSGAKG